MNNGQLKEAIEKQETINRLVEAHRLKMLTASAASAHEIAAPVAAQALTPEQALAGFKQLPIGLAS